MAQTGIRNVNVVPTLTSLLAVSSPPQLHRPLRDRQPQPGSFRLLTALALYLAELIEYVGQVLGWDADAGVGYG